MDDNWILWFEFGLKLGSLDIFQKKLQIFKKILKKVLTLVLRCGILTMQSPKKGLRN